jgi:hypothetical protein
MDAKIYQGHRQLVNSGAHAVYADAESGLGVIDMHRELKKSGRATLTASTLSLDMTGQVDGVGQVPLNIANWLPFAAAKYEISANLEDHLFVPVIAIPTDLPNRNRVAFPLKELLDFNTEIGMQAYKTWIGMPTYREHQNNDIKKAHGVIADVSLVPMRGWSDNKVWKVLMFATFDRSKYTDYVAKIASKEINSYSMGAWVSDYACSVCAAKVNECDHLVLEDRKRGFSEHGGVLAFRNCIGIKGFELSSVSDPAWYTAISDNVSTMDAGAA